ncbi:hypothetical protein [Streptomyces sp. NPDC002133]|uniref:hypothetical protein n=1 Tax=Streptomyces sp. NPDC002133 TaxID=3154409 RepID=UPI003318BB63
MSHQENAVFVDASGRRRRFMKYASVAVGAACVCFVAVVLAGLFGAGPAGGPLPWSQSREEASPTAEPPPSTAESGEPAEDDPGSDPVGDPISDRTSPSASASPGSGASTRPGADAPVPSATTQAPPAGAPTASAPPGNSGNAPRHTPTAEGKGPK